MRNFLYFVIFILSGCVTSAQLETGLNYLLDRNISEAFQALGYPSGKQQFGDDTVYVWSVNQSGALVLPSSSTTTGNVGTTSFSATTSSTQVVPVSHNCVIKLVTGPDKIIKHWEFNGNVGGCSEYSDRVDSYYEAANPEKYKEQKTRNSKKNDTRYLSH